MVRKDTRYGKTTTTIFISPAHSDSTYRIMHISLSPSPLRSNVHVGVGGVATHAPYVNTPIRVAREQALPLAVKCHRIDASAVVRLASSQLTNEAVHTPPSSCAFVPLPTPLPDLPPPGQPPRHRPRLAREARGGRDVPETQAVVVGARYHHRVVHGGRVEACGEDEGRRGVR